MNKSAFVVLATLILAACGAAPSSAPTPTPTPTPTVTLPPAPDLTPTGLWYGVLRTGNNVNYAGVSIYFSNTAQITEYQIGSGNLAAIQRAPSFTYDKSSNRLTVIYAETRVDDCKANGYTNTINATVSSDGNSIMGTWISSGGPQPLSGSITLTREAPPKPSSTCIPVQ